MLNTYNDVSKVVSALAVAENEVKLLSTSNIKKLVKIQPKINKSKVQAKLNRKLFILNAQVAMSYKGQRKNRSYRIARLPKP